MTIHLAIAGAGIAGAVLARELAETGKYDITVFDERNHVGGSCHTARDEETGVMIHHYGPHIFHTDSSEIWDYINSWGKFSPTSAKVMASTERGIFSLPINLLTINQFFNKKLSPHEARDFIGSLGDNNLHIPKNLEEHALKILGKDLYQHFFYGPLKKQWGVDPEELPATLLGKTYLRFDYSDNYYDKPYQGIPVSGYTEIIKRILDHNNIELRLGTKLDPERKKDFDHLFWSGPMDDFFQYKLGRLNYRTLKFERFTEVGNYQGCAVMNYCEEEIPYTRIIEHKHFAPWEEHEKTVLFIEYYKNCEENDIPNIPQRLPQDNVLLSRYLELAQKEQNITFIGQLGTYRYLNMDEAVKESLDLAHVCESTDINLWPRFSYSPLL